MEVQLTTLTTVIGLLVMFGAWLFVGQRLKQAQGTALRPVTLLHGFFLYMGIFFVIMAAPTVWIGLDPSKFPLYMAWGYVLGHIFLYLAFTNIGRMLFTIIPKLSSKEPVILMVGLVATAVITVINAVTMIWGTQPAYNFERHLIQYNAAPAVGASIGILALLTVMPAAILFLANAVRNPASRVRSLLLGSGFLLMVAGGPLHDVATSWQMYMAADIITILSVVLVGAGVVYRFNQSLSLAKPAAPTTAPVAGA
jgi:hypothetical protein